MNDYVFQEYPKWVTVDGVPVLCDDAQAEKALLGKEASVEDLTKAAIELGIKVDARWGAKRLQEEITKAA